MCNRQIHLTTINSRDRDHSENRLLRLTLSVWTLQVLALSSMITQHRTVPKPCQLG